MSRHPARDRNGEPDARAGEINNLAFSHGEPAVQPDPSRRILVSTRRLTSVLTPVMASLLALHLAARAIEIHRNLLGLLPCHAADARRRLGTHRKRKFVGNFQTVVHFDQRASRRDIFHHAQDAAVEAARNYPKFRSWVALLHSLIDFDKAGAADK